MYESNAWLIGPLFKPLFFLSGMVFQICRWRFFRWFENWRRRIVSRTLIPLRRCDCLQPAIRRVFHRRHSFLRQICGRVRGVRQSGDSRAPSRVSECRAVDFYIPLKLFILFLFIFIFIFLFFFCRSSFILLKPSTEMLSSDRSQ